MHKLYLLSVVIISALLVAACNPAPQAASTPTTAATPTPEAPPATAPEPTALPSATPTAEPMAAATEPPTPGPVATDTPEASAQEMRFVIIPEETTASYSIQETLINRNNTIGTAVGTTRAVEGWVALNYEDPTASEFGQFTVDISTLTSDRARRDNAIRNQWLESARYPLATFVVKEVRGFPPGAGEGQSIQFQLVGDMAVRETTREVAWDVTATLDGNTLSGTATTFIMLEDFNVPVPNIAGILSVTDGATLTLDFAMQAAG